MSSDKLMRLGPSRSAEQTRVKQEGIKKESSVEAKEVKPVEKTMESTMAESLDSLERRRGAEKDRSEQAFALETFCMHGGQELVQIFGAEKVFDAVNSLVQTRKGGEELPNLLDVVKKLVPDAKDRQKVYDQMDKGAKDFLSQKEEEEQKLAHDGDEDANKRFWDIYHGGGNAGADGNTLRCKQFTIESLRRMDSILGKLFSGKGEKHMLDFPAVHIVQEGFKGNLGKLKEELTAPGREDFLVAVHEMRSQIDKDDAERIQEATEIYKQSDQEIRKITLELNNELAGKVNKILEDLQSTLSKHTGSETGDKIIASIAAAVQKDIEAFQQAADKEIERRTAKLKEVRGRAANASRPYWQ